MTNQLIALLDGREVGTVQYKNARLSFLYTDEWRADPNAYPLSLSMPLASAEHGHARIEAFLWCRLRTGFPLPALRLGSCSSQSLPNSGQPDPGTIDRRR